MLITIFKDHTALDSWYNGVPIYIKSEYDAADFIRILAGAGVPFVVDPE